MDYTGTSGKQCYTTAFLDIDGASDRTSRDITKVLETQSSEGLAPHWVAENLQPH
jgi:hypothetical protein